jgi:hypothetical protein
LPRIQLIDNYFDGAATGGRRSRENTGDVDPDVTLSSKGRAPRSGYDAYETARFAVNLKFEKNMKHKL